MKNLIKSSLIVTGLVLAGSASADRILEFKGEAYYGLSESSGSINGEDVKSLGLEDNEFAGYSFAFEHFLPFIPNLKIDIEDFKEESNTKKSGNFKGYSFSTGEDISYKLRTIDAIGYYQILDGLGWVSADIGFGYTKFGGDLSLESSKESFDDNTGIVYAMARADVPTTGWYFGVDGKQGIGKDNIEYKDIKGYVGYDFDGVAFDVGVKAGYKQKDVLFEDYDYGEADIKMDGVFLGVVFTFL